MSQTHGLYRFLLSVYDVHLSIIFAMLNVLTKHVAAIVISWTTHFLLLQVSEAIVMIFNSFMIVVYE